MRSSDWSSDVCSSDLLLCLGSKLGVTFSLSFHHILDAAFKVNMNDTRYPLWTRRFHWLVFILVASALILIYAHGWSPKGSTMRDAFKWAHIQIGRASCRERVCEYV